MHMSLIFSSYKKKILKTFLMTSREKKDMMHGDEP